jgi:hypothetical protein
MPNKHPPGRLAFDDPAVYQIRVQGRIPARWFDGLQGMTVDVADQGDGPPVTTLEGELLDQASLVGVLDGLYELRLPVLSVECLKGMASD